MDFRVKCLEVFGRLGYTLNSSEKFTKMYGQLQVIISPGKDNIELISFTYPSSTIEDMSIVPADGDLSKCPSCCRLDVMEILANLSPRQVGQKESYIINETCSVCEGFVQSFFKMPNKTVLCIQCLAAGLSKS